MTEFEVLIPKLGESIQEATITKIFVKIGDKVEEDDPLFEVATDKVDSEIPPPVSGIIKSISCEVDELLAVGKVAMVIDLVGKSVEATISSVNESVANDLVVTKIEATPPKTVKDKNTTTRFYSPLVKNIAKKEGIQLSELEDVEGSGIGGRIQKSDLLRYIEERSSVKSKSHSHDRQMPIALKPDETAVPQRPRVSVSIGAEDTIIEMDRIRKLIASHMVMSKQTAPHVTSFVEADATEMVIWRNKNKDDFQAEYGQKLTFLPYFTEAVAKALTEYRMINSSVDGDKIILRKKINIGIAVATNSYQEFIWHFQRN